MQSSVYGLRRHNKRRVIA
ncbi:hypothetical protein Golax_017520 [Gossypium laxum]|uniref:Uncharacterized protein n=1 Tax=Gossypium laxum TaxID=34288 RepID=A0A7J8Z0H0_9ROSI|nr:hypothetical protein [Gossypium laxum]